MGGSLRVLMHPCRLTQGQQCTVLTIAHLFLV
jgi:hypothetical protein